MDDNKMNGPLGRKKTFSPKVILLGSHRSGTSLLSQVLQKNNIDMGGDLDHNEESKFFIELNDWILANVGGRWDFPSSVSPILEDPEIKLLTLDYISQRLKSFGFSNYHRGAHGKQAYGWKDPRNTFTFPVWKEIFPNLRGIHVIRNGLDVTQSLYTRSRNDRRLTIKRYGRRRRLFRYLPKKGQWGLSVLHSAEQYFRLWETYVQHAEDLSKKYPGQIATVKYEDILSKDYSCLDIASKLIGMKLSLEKVDIRPPTSTHDGVEHLPEYAKSSIILNKYYPELFMSKRTHNQSGFTSLLPP